MIRNSRRTGLGVHLPRRCGRNARKKKSKRKDYNSMADDISHVIQLALAPVFLLAVIGAFVNAFASRLSRIFLA